MQLGYSFFSLKSQPQERIFITFCLPRWSLHSLRSVHSRQPCAAVALDRKHLWIVCYSGCVCLLFPQMSKQKKRIIVTRGALAARVLQLLCNNKTIIIQLARGSGLNGVNCFCFRFQHFKCQKGNGLLRTSVRGFIEPRALELNVDQLKCWIVTLWSLTSEQTKIICHDTA